MFPPNSPPSAAAADLTAFAELRPASGEPGSSTLHSNEISASPSHRSPHTDPNLHMSCLVCNNALGAGGNGPAYYSCSGSSAGHGHSTVCVPCFSSPKARLTGCLVRMAARGQEELTGNHVVASALKFGDGLPAVRLGESEPIAFVVYNSKGKCGTFVCKNCHDAGHRCALLSTDEVNQTLSMTLRTRSVGVTGTNARGDDSLDDMLNSAANDFTVTNQLKSTSYKLQCTNVVDEVECALALIQLEEGIDDLPETFSPLLLTAREDGPELTEARRLLGWAGGFSTAPTHTAW